MNITPNHISIGRIFEQNFLFEVPKYQRYYAWEDEQIGDFIKDIDNILQNSTPDKPLEHFFGGIVCASKTVEGSNRQQKELIDGQQRITTAILLIINIIGSYKELQNQPRLSIEDKAIISSRIKKLTEKYIEYQDEINRRPKTVYKLVLSIADRDYFEGILNGVTIEESRDSHKRLARANFLLKKYVHSELDKCATITEKIDKLANIENVLHTSSTVIFMDCDSRESAYKLFQVLNDRGAGLNEGDLLKSKTLEALESFPREQENAQKYWDEILKEEPKQVENFLRTYYASFCGKRAGRTSLYDDFLEKFFPDLANSNIQMNQTKAITVLECIENIFQEIRVYRKIINGDWPFPEMQPVTGWDRYRLNVLVKFLAYDITMPILLAAVKLDHKKYAELVHNLEKFMFRYKTICGNGHQNLSELYMTEAKKIRDNPNTYSFRELYTNLRTLISEKANDETFEVRLKNLKYNSAGGNKPLRYFLSTLCDYDRWYNNGANGHPIADKENVVNYDNVTIEHIDSLNPETQDHIFLEPDIHKLFNLTILSQDDNGHRVANKTFAGKKIIYQASKYSINHKLGAYDEWTIENAENWQQYLVDFACKVFVV